ncbi:hypothetical protein BTUL_0001g00400 [Botrytis tulipae]|uniref:Aminoglycoside phosphotransferase domain-containing protein n=1 Tax=Botrytis tulipae TaxID=87230 RepID=A0A4Z1FBD8_9HELO|nr:hypothetical protein BTUL_0001g00400 [Botrytis tulipae]
MATDHALEIISRSTLSPNKHLLLKYYIEGAVDSALAASYLTSILNLDQDVEPQLFRFLLDWRMLACRLTTSDPIPKRFEDLLHERDGSRCSLTKMRHKDSISPVESAHVIPPTMLDGIEWANEGRLLRILEAFLSPSYVARLRNILSDQVKNDESYLKNLWLLTPMSSEMKKRRWLFPEDCYGLFLGDGTEWEDNILFTQISTPDMKRLPLPSCHLFEVHSRFATALHQFFVDDKISKGWPKGQRLGLLSDFPFPPIRQLFCNLWLRLPSTARVYCYHYLVRFGRWLYGPTGAISVTRIPLGLYIKQTTRSGLNEPNALKLIEEYTSIPAPRLVDVAEHGDEHYLVMTRVRGQQLRHVYHLMSYTERDCLAGDLAGYVAQLRKIPNPTAYMISDTLGGPVFDHRIPNNGIGGPFNTEADFNNFLVSHIDSTPVRALGEENVPRNHRSVFTHSDLHWSNILVDQGKLSGIIDWECAGFMPEYWEFTKAMYKILLHKDKMELIRRAFGNKYEKELKAETKLWEMTPFGC